MSKKYEGICQCVTDIGQKRMENDDKALALQNERGDVLLCIFDGMGGHNQGNYAALMASKTFKAEFLKKERFFTSIDARLWLKKIIRTANSIIYNKATNNEEYKGSGTTMSIALLHKNKLIVAQMGDSRIYLVNENNELLQITEDQTVAMHEYRTGLIPFEDVKKHPGRHILTNALGIYRKPKFDLKVYKYNLENIMACSDGLYNNLPDSQIGTILTGEDSIEQKLTELVHQANFNGGSDNIAISLWEIN